jgi:hypothetical protein
VARDHREHLDDELQPKATPGGMGGGASKQKSKAPVAPPSPSETAPEAPSSESEPPPPEPEQQQQQQPPPPPPPAPTGAADELDDDPTAEADALLWQQMQRDKAQRNKPAAKRQVLARYSLLTLQSVARSMRT